MQILEKEILVNAQHARIVRFTVTAPEIARKAQPGQFVVLMVSEKGERIPLTVVEKKETPGTIVLIVQELGMTTKLLGQMNPGDTLFALAGPLGHPTMIKRYGTVVIVGGGVGIAEIYPVAQALKAAGNRVIGVVGARTKELLILTAQLASVCDEVRAATDDGSFGRKGFTTDVLNEVLESGMKVDLAYAAGPLVMMRRVADVTKKFTVPTTVSLNALMVDGTGMCGCCRVTVGGQIRFSCVDGPEFDAHTVDWQELIKRNQIYIAQEQHVCKLTLTDHA